jgi:hypothetical protein
MPDLMPLSSIRPHSNHGGSTRARIVRAPVTLKRGDLLAIPEVYGDALPHIAQGFPRVSINQNAFVTFENVSWLEQHPYSRCPSLVGVMTMSQHDHRYLTRTFPDLNVHRAYCKIDSSLFGYADGPRPRKIAYMPRKRKQQAAQIIGSLHARGALGGWTLAPISGLNHSQVSDLLGTSQLFLSFSQREGFGLPPAEALGRGCYVIGYAGWGGVEYFNPDYSRLVPEDDLEGFVSAVEDWIRNSGWNPDVALAGSRAILQTYSAETERSSVLEFFKSVSQQRSGTHCPETAVVTVGELVVPSRSTFGLMASRVRSGVRQIIDRLG